MFDNETTQIVCLVNQAQNDYFCSVFHAVGLNLSLCRVH